MAQWTMTDNAAGSPNYANAQFSSTKNQTELFNNTTQDDVVTNMAVGVFAAADGEMAAERAAGVAKPAHSGWSIRTEGDGGRAGRVQYEVLVAGGITGDSEDTVLQDFLITIGTQPADDSVTGSADATFTVAATTTPSGGTLSYQWQVSTDGGSNWASTVDADGTAATLTVTSTDAEYVDANEFRCVVSVTGGDDVTSTAATLTVA